MNAKGEDDAADTERPETRLMAILEKNIAHREINVIDDEAAVLRRVQLTASREAAVHVREEGAATRERDIRAAEAMQAGVDHHMIMLQQANAQLVITSIETQQLAEQIECVGLRDGTTVADVGAPHTTLDHVV